MSTDRLAAVDWDGVAASVEEHGWCQVPGLLTASECEEMIELYVSDDRFRTTVSMERHGYGRGEYRYFKYPLPRLVGQLRHVCYAGLVPLANLWAERLRREARYPESLDAYLEQCHEAGQRRPTPLLLRYESGGYNRLHQDLYGALSFPLQIVVPLSEPGRDYLGGELVFVEQAPRAQARATVLQPQRGDAVVFPNAERPVRGVRGWVRHKVRHGAATITRGRRYALGLIFHDAE